MCSLWEVAKKPEPPTCTFKGSLQVHTRAEEAPSDDNPCMGACGLRGAFQPFASPGALAFCPFPTKRCKGFATHWCFGSPVQPQCQLCTQKQLRAAENTWVWSMWCISSLVVPTIISSLSGKSFDPCPCGLHLQLSKLETWMPALLCTDNSKSHVAQIMPYCAKQWKTKMLH